MPEHAVVTGGSSGIGWATVLRLLERGLQVTVLDLAPSTPEAPAEHADRLRTFAVDVTDEAAVGSALAEAERAAGPPRRLVTSHGIRGEFEPALELDLDSYRRVLDVHVVGTLVVARALVRGLDRAGESPDGETAERGSIVTLSSTTAYRGWRNQADYGVAKAAVRQLTENLAVEWAEQGVRVNSVAPGHTLTPMVREMIDEGYDISATKARVPLGRLASPSEMAAAIEHLLLDASFTTGVCLPVDGGWTAVGN